MANTKYRGKRQRAGLNIYDVACYLGIPYDKALEIDRGKRDLAEEYVDKYEEMLQNSASIKIAREEKLFNAKAYFLSDEPKKDLAKLNYTQKNLRNIFNCSAEPIARVFNKRLEHVSDDFVLRMYDFLHDYINKNIETDETIIKPTKIDYETVKNIQENYYDNVIFIPRKKEEKVEQVNEEFVEEKTNVSENNNEIIEKYENLLKVRNDYITKLERQIMIYEKLIEKL